MASPFEPRFADSPTPWLAHLEASFPLLTFQPAEYAKYWSSPFPREYPIDVMVESIIDDENCAYLMDERDGPRALRFTLHHSRVAVAFWPFNTFANRARGNPDPSGNWMRQPQRNPWPVDVKSADALVGRLLRERRDALDRATTKQERESAKDDLDSLLNDFGGVPTNRPPEGPTPKLSKALYHEAKGLMELCWDLFPVRLQPAAVTEFERLGVHEAEQRETWAVRTVLPILSRSEVLALRSEALSSHCAGRKLAKPTPARFAIWLLARRLGLEPDSFARKMRGTSGADYFRQRRRQNPIDNYPLPDMPLTGDKK